MVESTTTVKVTKALVLKAIMALVSEAMKNGEVISFQSGEVVSASDITSYCETTLTQLDNKKAKAVVAAAKKRAESDEIRKVVYGVLEKATEALTPDEIAEIIDDENISKSKVVPRLTALVNEGLVEKTVLKAEGGKKKTAYFCAPVKSVQD